MIAYDEKTTCSSRQRSCRRDIRSPTFFDRRHYSSTPPGPAADRSHPVHAERYRDRVRTVHDRSNRSRRRCLLHALRTGSGGRNRSGQGRNRRRCCGDQPGIHGRRLESAGLAGVGNRGSPGAKPWRLRFVLWTGSPIRWLFGRGASRPRPGGCGSDCPGARGE